MFVSVLQSLAARIRAAVNRGNRRRNLRPMLMLDDHLLRDIGLTRADVIACVSSPESDPSGVLDLARRRDTFPSAYSPARGPRMAA